MRSVNTIISLNKGSSIYLKDVVPYESVSDIARRLQREFAEIDACTQFGFRSTQPIELFRKTYRDISGDVQIRPDDMSRAWFSNSLDYYTDAARSALSKRFGDAPVQHCTENLDRFRSEAKAYILDKLIADCDEWTAKLSQAAVHAQQLRDTIPVEKAS